ncbi:MAG: hypothetical protein IKD46_09690 [Lentisphaeria bacterium]|nr:hypothetical protein [Lentisphaeria bacterium]
MKNYANMQTLNGLWDFTFVQAELSDTEICNTAMTDIVIVPGCFDAASKFFGKRGTGIYRREVRCSGKIQLEFQAIGLRARIFWDGKPVATIPWAFTPQSVVIDNPAEEAWHQLTVAVENTFEQGDSAMYHPFYDFYAFGGIYRNVTLRELADTVWLDRIQVTPLSVAEGTAEVAVFLAGAPEARPVKIYIDDILCAEETITGSGNAVCKVPAPAAPWTPENPVLHKIKVCTGNDFLETHFGLRTLSWNDGQLKLNGTPLKLIGYCRHDSHPETGYAISESRVLADMKLIKEQGCNFVRGSHYNQSEFLLDCCDRLGLLVWNESCGWGNKEEQCADPVFVQKQVEQSAIMVQETYNHPSIIMWGCMNELASDTPAGRNILEQIFKKFRELDRSRPVTFASNRRKADICYDLVDIISTNIYPGWYDEEIHFDDSDQVLPCLKDFEEYFSGEEFRNKPWIISEIGAAAIIGDHSGGRWSEEYQAKIIGNTMDFVLKSERCTGTALWLFANANTYFDAIHVMTRPRGFNNKGLLSEYRAPKLAWHLVSQIMKQKA